MKLILFLFISTIFVNQGHACSLESMDSIHCNPFTSLSNVDIPFADPSVDCSDDVFAAEAREQYLKHSKGESESKRWINGKRYTGKKSDLLFLKKMVTARGHLNQVVKDALKSCDTALCVLEKSFNSKEAAYRALNISYTSGYHISLTQKADIDYLWSLKELRDLNYSVNIMPQSLLHSNSMGNFYVLPDGYNQSGKSESISGWASVGMNNTGEIVFRDHIRKKVNWSTSVMIHEMAHQFDYHHYVNTNYKTFKSSQLGYLKVNGWKISGQKYEDIDGFRVKRDVWIYDKSKSCFPREYASESPREDFAEAITYYIKDSDYLKTKCPDVYAFMKAKVFNNKEFPKPKFDQLIDQYIANHDSELRQCVNSPVNLVSILDNTAFFGTVEPGTNGWSAGNSFKVEVMQECSRDLVEKLKEQMDFDSLSCSMRTRPVNMTADVQNKLVAKYEELIKKEVRDIVGPSKVKALSEECVANKDLRDQCVKDKLNNSIKKLGYAIEAFERIDFAHNLLATPKLSELGMNPTKAMIDCFKDSFNLKFYMTRLDNFGFACRDQAKQFLDGHDYKYDDNLLYQAANEIQSTQNKEILKFIANEIATKTKNDLKGSCWIVSEKCVKNQIKELLIDEFSELREIDINHFTEVIYGVL